jgi:glycosyltransferase involved in cell wall biosynthesis
LILKIVIPTIGLDNRGGTRITIQIANHLAVCGHKVTFILPRGTLQTKFPIHPDIELRQVGILIPQKEDLSSIIRTLMIIPFIPPTDILLANYYLTAYPSKIAHRLGRARRVVYYIQAYEPIQFGTEERTFPKLKRVIAEQTYRFNFHNVTVSRWVADQIRQVSRQPVQIVHPGIDLNLFNPGSMPKQERSILIFPSHDIYKGWGVFLDSYHKHRSRWDSYQITASSPLGFPISEPGIVQKNPATDQELVNLYGSASIYLHPSWVEGCPLAPLEAMACGTPVVAAVSGGIMEYAQDGENCLLVPEKDPDALIEKTEQLLADRALWERLRAGGLRTAAQFDIQHTVTDLEALFLRVLES